MIKFLLDENYNIHRHLGWEDVAGRVAENTPFFLDIKSPTHEDIQKLGSIFKFHPTNLEDCTFFSESPKIEEHKHYLFTVVHSIGVNESGSSFENHEVHIFLGSNYVITVHDAETGVIHDAMERILDSDREKELSSENAFYVLLDSVVDSYFPVMNHWSSEIDDVEEAFFDKKSDGDIVERLMPIRKGLLMLKRIIMPQREIIYRISHTNINFISEETRIYLRDVFDHIAKSYEFVEEHRDALSNLMDAHFSKTSANLNEVMKRLTVISTIFMPLTFIVGVYGMNFSNMPELTWKYGYLAVMMLMIVGGGILVWYFKRKNWF